MVVLLKCVLTIFVVLVLDKLIECHRTGASLHSVYYGSSLLDKGNRNVFWETLSDKPTSYIKGKTRKNGKRMQYKREWVNLEDKRDSDLSLFKKNRFVRSHAPDNPKYLAYGFKDEYFPHRTHNSVLGDKHLERPFKENTNNQNKPIRHSVFVPKTIPLIRPMIPPLSKFKKSSKYSEEAVSWRTTVTPYGNPDSDLLGSLNSRPMQVIFGYKTNVQLDADTDFKGDKTDFNTINSTKPSGLIYGIHQNVYPTRPMTHTILPTNQAGSQVPQIPGPQYASKDVNNIPKPNQRPNSDIIISKDTSGQFNSDQSSDGFAVGVGEEATNSRVNKNGGSSGLRQSRLNNIAVVVSSSMTVKED